MSVKRICFTPADLRVGLEAVAGHRRRMLAEDPDDVISLKAATLLDRLAETADKVDPNLITAFDDLFDDTPDLDAYRKILWAVGVCIFPATATEFVRYYIAHRSGVLRD